MKSYIYRNEINPRTLHNKLIREKEVFYDTEETINSPDIVHLLMTELFGLDRRAEEYMFMIALNSKSHPLGFFEISHGTVTRPLYRQEKSLFEECLQEQ
jgi:DNA repair protein RadC